MARASNYTIFNPRSYDLTVNRVKFRADFDLEHISPLLLGPKWRLRFEPGDRILQFGFTEIWTPTRDGICIQQVGSCDFATVDEDLSRLHIRDDIFSVIIRLSDGGFFAPVTHSVLLEVGS